MGGVSLRKRLAAHPALGRVEFERVPRRWWQLRRLLIYRPTPKSRVILARVAREACERAYGERSTPPPPPA